MEQDTWITVAAIIVCVIVLVYLNSCATGKPKDFSQLSQTQQLGVATTTIASLARNAGDYYRSGYMSRASYKNVLNSLTRALNAIERSTYGLAIDKPVMVNTNSRMAQAIIGYVQGVMLRHALSRP